MKLGPSYITTLKIKWMYGFKCFRQELVCGFNGPWPRKCDLQHSIEPLVRKLLLTVIRYIITMFLETQKTRFSIFFHRSLQLLSVHRRIIALSELCMHGIASRVMHALRDLAQHRLSRWFDICEAIMYSWGTDRQLASALYLRRSINLSATQCLGGRRWVNWPADV